jgi:hypothetical protein
MPPLVVPGFQILWSLKFKQERIKIIWNESQNHLLRDEAANYAKLANRPKKILDLKKSLFLALINLLDLAVE